MLAAVFSSLSLIIKMSAKAQCSSCHLSTTLGTNFLTGKSYTTTQMMKGSAHVHPVWGGLLCRPQTWWGGCGHPPQEQQQPVSGRWGGLPSPGAGPYPTVTSPLGWITCNHPTSSSPTSLSSAEHSCFPRQSCRQGSITCRVQGDSICLSS